MKAALALALAVSATGVAARNIVSRQAPSDPRGDVRPPMVVGLKQIAEEQGATLLRKRQTEGGNSDSSLHNNGTIDISVVDLSGSSFQGDVRDSKIINADKSIVMNNTNGSNPILINVKNSTLNIWSDGQLYPGVDGPQENAKAWDEACAIVLETDGLYWVSPIFGPMWGIVESGGQGLGCVTQQPENPNYWEFLYPCGQGVCAPDGYSWSQTEWAMLCCSADSQCGCGGNVAPPPAANNATTPSIGCPVNDPTATPTATCTPAPTCTNKPVPTCTNLPVPPPKIDTASKVGAVLPMVVAAVAVACAAM